MFTTCFKDKAKYNAGVKLLESIGLTVWDMHVMGCALDIASDLSEPDLFEEGISRDDYIDTCLDTAIGGFILSESGVDCQINRIIIRLS